MRRIVAFLGAAVMLSGCQAQNPYSMFGPHRVPTPGLQAPAPYYPANVGAATGIAPPHTASPAESARPSISFNGSAPAAATTTDAGDKEPIRIVENPAPAARTATTGTTRSAGTPANALPAAPAGMAPAAPTSGKSSLFIRTESGVSPASYEQPAAPAAGWKLR